MKQNHCKRTFLFIQFLKSYEDQGVYNLNQIYYKMPKQFLRRFCCHGWVQELKIQDKDILYPRNFFVQQKSLNLQIERCGGYQHKIIERTISKQCLQRLDQTYFSHLGLLLELTEEMFSVKLVRLFWVQVYASKIQFSNIEKVLKNLGQVHSLLGKNEMQNKTILNHRIILESGNEIERIKFEIKLLCQQYQYNQYSSSSSQISYKIQTKFLSLIFFQNGQQGPLIQRTTSSIYLLS
ncbi:unnamed protein product [Paramecium octaurelia]|uniref:Uncharacterized protein n=1 Tax=Paramecium octaurelia TaxID=43137 RepID=A0A8S1X010_PAROT|nr:unnamed protein product [Paramecium octaurelia]